MLYDVDSDTVLDFRQSHDTQTSKIFAERLFKFLLKIGSRPRGLAEGSLNNTVAKQYDDLLAAVRCGQKVRSLKDVEMFFDQQYILKAFSIIQDKIIWDGETTTESNENKADWTFCWSKRRVWVLRQVYQFRGPVAYRGK